jgi:hypothetical protein
MVYFLLKVAKMVDRADAIAAPIEPFAGFEREGFGTSGGSGFGLLNGATIGGTFPPKVMVGSSSIIANSKPAQPG